MPDKWNFYLKTIDGQITSVYLNLGLYESLPYPKNSWLHTLSVTLKHPTQQGLTNDQESESLNRMEDTLIRLGKQIDAIFAGRITGKGERIYYFYATDSERMQDIIQSNTLNGYEFSSDAKQDPEWRLYLKGLYPTADEKQCMENLGVIQQLRQHGDTLVDPRPVEHYVYFTNETRQAEFEDAIKGHYQYRRLDPIQDNTKPYGTLVETYTPVTPNNINEVVLAIFHKANEFNGEYDGWETEIIRKKGLLARMFKK